MYSNRPLPHAISHRGLSTNASENSIPAFLAAIDAGADGIELDVHASGDGVLFVHHDPGFRSSPDDPSRTTFASVDAAEIAKARLRGGEAIPTLDQTIEAVGGRVSLFIEIKAAGLEADIVRCLRRHAGFTETFAVHAFDHRIAKRMLELMPSVRTGVLQASYPLDSCAVMRWAGASDLWQHADFIDAALVADVHSCGGRVIAWTVNHQADWSSLAKLGVDGICTDSVDAYVTWRNDSRED